jgi:phosphoesterase RecJ-like protein
MTPRDPALDAAYEEVAKRLTTGKRFLITGHRNPDGDALGSALGLALALDARGKEARVVMRDAWSSAYAKMPGISRVDVADALPADWPSGWDALFTMECPEADRAGF